MSRHGMEIHGKTKCGLPPEQNIVQPLKGMKSWHSPEDIMLSQVARCKITRDVITAYELLRLGEGVSSPASGLVAFSS